MQILGVNGGNNAKFGIAPWRQNVKNLPGWPKFGATAPYMSTLEAQNSGICIIPTDPKPKIFGGHGTIPLGGYAGVLCKGIPNRARGSGVGAKRVSNRGLLYFRTLNAPT